MKKVLGKGLSALIPDTYIKDIKPKTNDIAATQSSAKQESAFQMISISDIVPNVDQPRKEFTEEAIQELAASIKEKGILQPVIVTKRPDGKYMLICGERRFRASILCGLSEIPVVIKEIAQEDFLEWALIENIQRQDLNAIEEAEAYRRLAEERMLSQEEIAKRVGKERSTVTNTLRLLRLPDEVRAYLAAGRLSAGHARAILGLMTPEHQRQMARRIVEENLSVRQVEAIVNRSNAHKRKPKTARNLKPEIVDLETRLAQHLGTQVRIYPRKNLKSGRIEIQYFTLDDLDRVLERGGVVVS
jgi:ParB family transcriptional regulator, chromosome partitioning protein